MPERGNLALYCATCGRAVEWLLGLPVYEDGMYRTRGAGSSTWDHLAQSPGCRPAVYPRSYGIEPRFYPRFAQTVPAEQPPA